VQVTGTEAYPLPNLSRLVEKGIHFTRAWAQPICAPTRATLFTGLNPWRTTIGDAAAIPEPILPLQLPTQEAPTIRTLADAVSEAGYQCAIFGKWDLGADHDTYVPTARGWHRHEGILAGGLRFIDENPPRKAEYEQIIQQDVRYVSWEKVVGDACIGTVRENIKPEERTHKYATADQIFGARNWIKHVNGSPWWVTLSLFSPHDPFHVPPKDTFTIQFKDPAKPSDQEMFVAMMESLDHYLGELFNDTDPEVREQLKNTVILFMGDNGTQDELDLIKGDDKSSVYIGGVHVPILITDGGAMLGDGPCYLDKSVVGTDRPDIVHIADVFQTIIDMAGGQGPTEYATSSISMLPYMRNTTQDARFANWESRPYNFAQFFAPPEIPGRYKKLGECATISDGTYKLNYQNGTYEFSELTYDPETDITFEKVTNNFQNPKAQELWQLLTTPGGPYYAEVDGKGKKFPPLSSETVTGPKLLGVGRDNQLYTLEGLTNRWEHVPNSGSVISVTTMPDGRILGVGTDNQLWCRQQVYSEWEHVPNSGSVISVTMMPDGKIVGVGTDNQLWYREDLTSEWILVPQSGSVIAIATMLDGLILGVNDENKPMIWQRDYLTSKWEPVNTEIRNVIDMMIMPDGTIVGAGTHGLLGYGSTWTGDWKMVYPYDKVEVIAIAGGSNAKRYKVYS
jgi:arylsulfatase A-like enzyme